MTQNLTLQTQKRPLSVKSIKTLGFYYKLRVGELAREWACPYTGGIACTLTLALDGPTGWHGACPYTGGIACTLTLALDGPSGWHKGYG